MTFNFCSHCGTKLQPDFRFCPSCGTRIPDGSSEPWTATTSPGSVETAASVNKTRLLSASHTTSEAPESLGCISSSPISTRPPLRNTRTSLRVDRGDRSPFKAEAPSPTPAADDGNQSQASPLKQRRVLFKLNEEAEPEAEFSPKSAGRAKGKMSTRSVEEKSKRKVEETDSHSSSSPFSSPVSSPVPRSPSTVKGKKKAKRVSAIEPLQEGEDVIDTTGRKWKLGKLLSQSSTELLYDVSSSSSKVSDLIVKLGAKDGRIYNEQNFLQRAAKPSSVDKWVKNNKMDFLGIPSCGGFGLHGDSYRFLVFPDMGRSLQSLMQEEGALLSEKTILQLALRLLDVLEYIHSNEYVHADIQAENIYIKPGGRSQVYLVGYGHAFRYCPGGRHAEYHEASRAQHEGAIEFISPDAHKGAAPTRRSDLQALGFCMLSWHTGTLPWAELTNPEQVANTKRRYMDDVPALVSHCFGKKQVFRALQAYLTEVMALQYTDQPDYAALKAGLSAALLQLGGSLEEPFSL